ncbi:hypothetical protein P2H44_07625 [Albimonas sp. CAU 1670]|uniref:hypothetical protein n=1 Tax=Albimonas sp. CAU 1670 TaxID=3032599 RepID=UPI0023DBFBBC|nr:hypothetical protein [Albimonas sp. CAU 1670]MDF2232418.1 hypothetical protein [Albimonas sp. CAU 1670]
MAFGWTYRKSGLGLRDDDFSWQGSAEIDPRFFLRRSKTEPKKITDLILGNLPDNKIETLLAEFLMATGGLMDDCLIFTSIGTKSDKHDDTVATFDRIASISSKSAALAGRTTENIFLDPDGDYWNAVLILRPASLP